MNIVYRLQAADGAEQVFSVDLDPATLALKLPPRSELPEWTRLNFCQCPDCPLANDEAARCPMAVALVDLQDFAGRLDSYAPLTVEVSTPERQVRMNTPAQRAVSSLMGLLIATCACPDVAWLRPMARFHLPMASEEETVYRATSMYSLAQYFRQKSGAEPDRDLGGLSKRYQRLHQINLAMAARLREVTSKDASVNAVVLLDLFAKAMPYSVDDSVAELAYLFDAYLEHVPQRP
jgi:hypothetical protein